MVIKQYQIKNVLNLKKLKNEKLVYNCINMECQVCCEKFLDVVKCGFCNYHACKVCLETYLFSSKEYMECMSCKREFTRHMIVTMFDKYFLEKYKVYYSNILFDFQKAYIPDVVKEINKNKKINDMNEKYNTQYNKVKSIEYKFNNLKNNLITAYSESNMNVLLDLTKKMINEEIILNQIHTELISIKNSTDISSTLLKCINCQFYCDDNGFCNSCQQSSCLKCLNIKNENHVCKNEDIESINLIYNQTKKCPGCDTRIYRSQGCSLMFCTSCHTVFSWTTGKITNPRINHNPHYIQHVRDKRLNNVTEDIIVWCGREIDSNFISKLFNVTKNINDFTPIYKFAVEIYYMRTTRRSYIKTYNDRIYLQKYILNQIEEYKYKSYLFKNFKDRKVCEDYVELIDTYINSATDIIYRFYQDKNKSSNSYIKEIQNLIDIINKELETLSKDYKVCKKQISIDTYKYVTVK